MEATSNSFNEEFPWQARCSGYLFNIREEIIAANEYPAVNPQRPRKELTREATYMICVILAFVLVAILGSTITTYEFFFKYKVNNSKNSMDTNEEKNVKIGNKSEKRKKYLQIYAWLHDCKCFVMLFCIFKNGRKIFKSVSPENQMDCIYGLRFIGSSWIMLYHISLVYFRFLRDVEKAKPFLEHRASQLLFSAEFPVDMFFVISGFLNAYFFFHQYSKCNGKIQWVNFYFKRVVRLTPVYMMVVGYFTILHTYTGTGIVWPTYDTNPVCRKCWWKYILYINNIDQFTMECMGWLWHLAVDMQLYIASPFFMISLMRWPRFGYFTMFTCIAGSCAGSFVLTYWLNLPDGFSRVVLHLGDIKHFYLRYMGYFYLIYIKPYSRLCPYLVGMGLGYTLYKKNIKKNITRNRMVTLWCGWITAFTFIWVSLFFLHMREEVLLETALYNGTKSLLSSCSVAWIIYVCLTKQADFLNNCLSWTPFIPLGRLSYCSYMVHVIILFRLCHLSEDVMDFSSISMVSLYLYICIFTYPVSFLLSMLFEIPILNIWNLFRKKKEEKTLKSN